MCTHTHPHLHLHHPVPLSHGGNWCKSSKLLDNLFIALPTFHYHTETCSKTKFTLFIHTYSLQQACLLDDNWVNCGMCFNLHFNPLSTCKYLPLEKHQLQVHTLNWCTKTSKRGTSKSLVTKKQKESENKWLAIIWIFKRKVQWGHG